MGQTSDEHCRSYVLAIQHLQGKWKIAILCAMRAGPVRLGTLTRKLPSASKKVLAENLRQLHASGLVVRKDLGGVVRRVEYEFADEKRSSLRLILDQLSSFGSTIQRVTTAGRHRDSYVNRVSRMCGLS